MNERGASWVDEALREHEEHAAAEHGGAGVEAAGAERAGELVRLHGVQKVALVLGRVRRAAHRPFGR